MSDERFMLMAVEVARHSGAEGTKPRPKVGAVMVRSGEVIDTAYRGELNPGEHGEYTLLQKKLESHDLTGTTLYTTLEPCTTRHHPKRPCVDWIIERGIGAVVVGMLDPNPQVYEKGIMALRKAGIKVDFFPSNLNRSIREDNEKFIEQFRASPALNGTVTFNYGHNNGLFSLGHGDLAFVTHWTNADAESIHVYKDGTGLRGVGLALSARSFGEVGDASVYDMTSRHQTPREGQFVVFQNAHGQFAAAHVTDIRAMSHGDTFDAVTIEYRINHDGGSRFAD